MSREVKRVSLDFDWPLRQVWRGYVNPHHGKAHDCTACDGSGYSPAARRYGDEWYGRVPFDPRSTGSRPWAPEDPEVWAFAERNLTWDHSRRRYRQATRADRPAVMAEARRLCAFWNSAWCHHLSKEDVDALLVADRLWDFTRVPRTEEERQIVAAKVAAGENSWLPESNGYRPTAAEVNRWSLVGMGHDSINQMVCVEARCQRLGEPHTCAVCDGHGELWDREEDRRAYEEWEPEEPPEGPGWQMWETVTEGSPISPVCATPEELARWMAEHGDGVTEDATYAHWLGMIRKGWAPSAVSDAKGFRSGVRAVGESVEQKGAST